jgi:hypothetical protein
MNELLDIVKDDDRLESNDLITLEPDVSDGSSYDGFINFTDGFIDCKAEYTPKRNEWLRFNGNKNKAQIKRAINAQKIHDHLCEYNFSDFFDWHIKDEDGDSHEFFEEFPTVNDFEKWFNEYKPFEKDPTPSLFTNKVEFQIDPKHDELYEYFLECDDEEYSESPAFLGVCLKLYDQENRHGDYKRMARVESYFNDDLSYGREHVGGWARLMGMTSADGSDIGNHYIYLSEFQYTTLNDLKRKLKPRIQKAYESLGM